MAVNEMWVYNKYISEYFVTSDCMALRHRSMHLQRTCQLSGFRLLFEKTNNAEYYSDLVV